jgi:hypothetical protein
MTSAYRLHQLDKPTTIRCPAVQAQFGAGFKELRHFRTTFLKALEAALAAYPDAKVTLDEAGVLLHWSALNPTFDRKCTGYHVRFPIVRAFSLHGRAELNRLSRSGDRLSNQIQRQ